MNELHPILQFIASYGYWIAIPIMIIEGPVITIVMGFLASLGLFNIFVVIALGTLSDLISDTGFYFSGRHGGERILRKLKIPLLHQNEFLQKVRTRFVTHPGKIFFGAKVLTGVAQTTFVLAGVTKINYKKILKYTIPGGMIWSAGLALLGYYFGKNSNDISRILSRTGIILFALLILFLLYEFWFGKYLAKKFSVLKTKNEEVAKTKSNAEK